MGAKSESGAETEPVATTPRAVFVHHSGEGVDPEPETLGAEPSASVEAGEDLTLGKPTGLFVPRDSESTAANRAQADPDPAIELKQSQTAAVEGNAAFAGSRVSMQATLIDLGPAYAAVRDEIVAINVKNFGAFQANAEANVALALGCFGAKTLSDLVEAQTKYARTQGEIAMRHMTDVADMASKAAASLAGRAAGPFPRG